MQGPVFRLLNSATPVNGNYELGFETPVVCTPGQWLGLMLQLVCFIIVIGAIAAVSTFRCGVKEVYMGPWDAPEPFVVNISGDYESLVTKKNSPPSPSFSSRSSVLGSRRRRVYSRAVGITLVDDLECLRHFPCGP